MKNLTFTVTLAADDHVNLVLPSGTKVALFPCNHKRFKLAEEEAFLLLKKNEIQLIGANKTAIPKLEFDKVVLLDASSQQLKAEQVANYLQTLAAENGLKLAGAAEKVVLPANITKTCARMADELFFALSAFDIQLEKKKKLAPKAQHRWKKALSNVEFYVQHEGTAGTVIWQKSTEMRLLAGAQLLPDSAAPRRADGSLGFTAKVALNLRQEHAASIDKKTNKTTEDIILRSVNEVGHFLYFAGTNSWLELIDDKGQTIHELSVVK